MNLSGVDFDVLMYLRACPGASVDAIMEATGNNRYQVKAALGRLDGVYKLLDFDNCPTTLGGSIAAVRVRGAWHRDNAVRVK